MKAENVRAVSIMLTSLAQRRSRDAVRDSGGLPTFLVAFHKPLGSFNTLFAGNTSHQFILSTRNNMDGGLLGYVESPPDVRLVQSFGHFSRSNDQCDK
jgi:hypothetical protein